MAGFEATVDALTDPGDTGQILEVAFVLLAAGPEATRL
jgi:hypothetical protein